MHFLSDHEYVAFLDAWWDEFVEDIREQFPLELFHTLTIAGQLGVKHPKDPKTGVLLVQTTDLLLTRSHKTTSEAWAVKDIGQITDERSMDKLEIERRYWEEKDVPWRLVVNDGLNSFRAVNLDWLFKFELLLRQDVKIDQDCIVRVLHSIGDSEGTQTAGATCRSLDAYWDAPPGAHASAMRYLFFSRILQADFDASKLANRPISSVWVNRGM